MEGDFFERKLELHYLAGAQGRRIVPLLLRVLERDDHPVVRRTAAELLGELRDVRSREVLLRRLSDCPDRLERQAVIRALGRLPADATVLVRLVPIMEHDSRAEVRREAADVVVRFSWELGRKVEMVRAARVFPETVARVLGLALQQRAPLSASQQALLLLLYNHPELQTAERIRFYAERLLRQTAMELER